MNDSPHSAALRTGRWSTWGTCYAITKNVYERRMLLANTDSYSVIADSLRHLRDAGRIKLLAFCVMPDHLHLLLIHVATSKISDTIRDFSRFTARKLNERIGTSGAFWQGGFHDHACRDDNDIEEHLNYIELNPFRAGLVERPEDWLYSSANPANIGMLDRDWYALAH